MKITVASFQKELEKAYFQGGKDEYHRAKTGKSIFGDLFGDFKNLFGKG